MTNEAAITRITDKLKTARRNQDGAINGNVRHGCYQSLKDTMKANGMDHNEACRAAWSTIKALIEAL
jgi:hypothetical protein